MNVSKEFIKGLWDENPILVLLLGLCPTLAVTTSAYNGLGMGAASTFVLVCSNLVISVLRSVIPKKVRIPCFIVVIATFVTIVDMVLKAYQFDLHRNLGLFVPLIVVNCIILGRAEAFASRRSIPESLIDGLGMGFGFTLTLALLGAVREFIGAGTITIFQMGETLIQLDPFAGSYVGVLVMILPPGAFISLGFMVALQNFLMARQKGEN